MLRLITKIGNSFKTYDFECQKLQEEYRGGDLIGIEIVSGLIWPRLVSIDTPGASKIKMIKAVRETTSLGLKEAKEFVESAPIDLPKIEVTPLLKLINDLRDAGAVVEA